MPQPRDRKPRQEDRPAPDAGAVEQMKPKQDAAEPQSGRTQPDRYAARDRQARENNPDGPEQNPPGRSERPDAVEGADASRDERSKRDRDLN